MTKFVKENPLYARMMPLIMAETLGHALGSVNQAMVVGLLVNSSKAFKAGAVAMGYPADFTMVEVMFKDILAHPQGLIVSKYQDDYFSMLKTEDKKLALKIDELLEPVRAATIETELAALKMPDEFPMILHSGLHVETNINTTLRNPEWNKTRGRTTLLVHESAAASLGVADEEMVTVTSAAS